MGVDLAAAAEHALGELLLAHFKGEDGAGKSLVGGDVLDEVHGEGGFAHGRAGGDDDHFAALQAIEHVVELVEAALQAVLAAVFDHLENFVQDLFHGLDGVTDFLVRDFEDFLFGTIEELVGLLVGGVGLAEDVVAGGDELAKQGLFANDLGVVGTVGGGGDAVEDWPM